MQYLVKSDSQFYWTNYRGDIRPKNLVPNRKYTPSHRSWNELTGIKHFTCSLAPHRSLQRIVCKLLQFPALLGLFHLNAHLKNRRGWVQDPGDRWIVEELPFRPDTSIEGNRCYMVRPYRSRGVFLKATSKRKFHFLMNKANRFTSTFSGLQSQESNQAIFAGFEASIFSWIFLILRYIEI